MPLRPCLSPFRTIAWACTFALGAIAAQAAQAAPDAGLLTAAQNAQPALVETLRQMVLIESGSQNAEGLLRMADLVEGRLKAAGLKTERRKTVAGAGADIVIGTARGTGQRKIMLMGHMDTVYPVGTLLGQPYRVDGKRIYGPGIADDKGGLAVILSALAILADRGWRDYDTLTVVMNPDEEVGSAGSRETIATLAEQQDAVLSFEPTAARTDARRESLLLGAAGTAIAVLQVKGRAAHAGAAPQLGRNALYELSHQLLQTRDIASGIPGVALQWTVAQANGPTNQITEHAQARADVRITRPGAERELEAALKARVAASQLIPDTETTVRLQMGRPAFVAGEKGRALAQKAQAIYGELGKELGLVPMTGGSTDAGFAARSGKPAVVEGFGLTGYGYHGQDEYIDADSIVPRLYLTMRLLAEVGKD